MNKIVRFPDGVHYERASETAIHIAYGGNAQIGLSTVDAGIAIRKHAPIVLISPKGGALSSVPQRKQTDSGFDARANLLSTIAGALSDVGIGNDVRHEAQTAVDRLAVRADEGIDGWADQLSRDLAAFRD